MTQNNSISMKTVVETYIIEETQELIYDNEKLAEWNQHVETLGLAGQKAIVKKDKSPIPFLHMKAPLVRAFEILCPRAVKIESYNKTPIPVEILDLVGLSKRENYFSKIEIWYDDETLDPAVIGYLGSYYTYDRSYKTLTNGLTEAQAQAEKESNPEVHSYLFQEEGKYLIGRWADMKQSLDQLILKAKGLFIAKEKSDIEQNIRENKRKLEDLEHSANEKFGFA